MNVNYVIIDADSGKIKQAMTRPNLSGFGAANYFAFNLDGSLLVDNAYRNVRHRLRTLDVQKKVTLDRSYNIFFSEEFNWGQCKIRLPIVSLMKNPADISTVVPISKAIVLQSDQKFKLVDYNIELNKRIWACPLRTAKYVWAGAETDYVKLTDEGGIQQIQAERAFMGRPEFAKKFIDASVDLLERELRPEVITFIYQQAQIKLARVRTHWL